MFWFLTPFVSTKGAFCSRNVNAHFICFLYPIAYKFSKIGLFIPDSI